MLAPDRTVDRDHEVRSLSAVSIQVPDDLLEKLSKDEFASLVLHSARNQPRPSRLTPVPTNRSLNSLVRPDPPGRASVCDWDSCLVPGNRADQPWEVGMYGLLGQMNFGSITIPLTIDCQEPLSALLCYCLMDCLPRTRRACSGL